MNVKEAVMSVLEASEKARNDDMYLCAEVYKKMGLPTDLNVLKDLNNKPSIETIVRCRRRAQELYHSLKATNLTEDKRRERTAYYKEIAKSVIRRNK